jgi:hypothetical protein
MERGGLPEHFTRALGPMFFSFCNCWINMESWMDMNGLFLSFGRTTNAN